MSPGNPYLTCTKPPGGMDAVIKLYAIQDDATRKIEWAQAVNVMRQVTERRTRNETAMNSKELTQQRIDDMCTHAHITEREAAAEKHAHTVVRRATDEVHNAADAEDAEAQSTFDSTYDLNGIWYRQTLPASVRLTRVSTGHESDKDRTTL